MYRITHKTCFVVGAKLFTAAHEPVDNIFFNLNEGDILETDILSYVNKTHGYREALT